LIQQKSEILAPVGNAEMLHAAIHNGADAVYAGVPGFNARGRSINYSVSELKNIIDEAHLYGIRVYLAFNILIFEKELEEAFLLFNELSLLSPDAFIVQDVGLARLMQAAGCQVPVHGSTQMTIACAEDIEFFKELDYKRFTLSRELSVEEISEVRRAADVELEAFVHGSLCISYSGQCMTSSGFGGRSANRGECAQSCRHPYELFVDDRHVQTDGPFLVSPQDLNGYEYLEKLEKLKLNSYKIEGRLKSPQYVAASCRIYSGKTSENIQTRLTFERGYFSGWLSGFDSKHLVDETFNSHTGIEVGTVLEIDQRDFVISNEEKISMRIGDGILLIGSGKEYGAYIRNIEDLNGKQKIFLGKDFAVHKIYPGMRVFLTHSVDANNKLLRSYRDNSEKKHLPVRMKFSGKKGNAAVLEIKDENNNSAVVRADQILEESKKNPCTVNDIRKELGALGGTPFYLESLDAELDENLFLPNQILKKLRREACARLSDLRIGIRRNVMEVKSFEKVKEAVEQKNINIISHPAVAGLQKNVSEEKKYLLNVLIRNPEHADILLSMPPGNIDLVYLEFEYGRFYDEVLQKLRDSGYRTGIALNRVMKTGEEKYLDMLALKKPDVFLVRNAGSLNYIIKSGMAEEFELVGDFSLNITNSLSAGYYLSRGLSRITSSYDLIDESVKNSDITRLESLLKNTDAARIEVIASYYLPSFYMEYCPYAHHLGKGGNYKTCGYPCKDHVIDLKDRVGEKHPLLTDQNCRNTMYNGRKRNLNGFIQQLKQMGVINFRLEALRDGLDLKKDILEMRSFIGSS